MKNSYIILFIFLSLNVFAQVPSNMSYQAVVRDGNQELLVNQAVGLRLSIVDSNNSTIVYRETQTITTNMNGLLTTELGDGSVVTGDLDNISWSAIRAYLVTEIDVEGGENYTLLTFNPLLSVPYALHAHTADSLTTLIPEEDPIFSLSLAAGIGSQDTARWNNPLPLADSGNVITYDGNNWIAKDLAVSTSNSGGGQSMNNMQPYLVLNYCIAAVGIFPSRNSAEPFIGEIELYGFNFPPRGYLTCDGQLLAISSNEALFSLLGTRFGGDGRTTFGIPDLRGRTALHQGQGPGLSLRQMGQWGGTETNASTINNLPTHSHEVEISFED